MSYARTPDSSNSSEPPAGDNRRVPSMVRIPARLMPLIDAAARGKGLSRSAYMVLAAIEKLERGQAR